MLSGLGQKDMSSLGDPVYSIFLYDSFVGLWEAVN